MLAEEWTADWPGAGGKRIYAVMSRSAAGDGSRVILTGHGFGGYPDEFLMRFARDRFLAAGYDVCRLAFYSWEPDARRLDETTLALQADDLARAFHALAAGMRVYLIGHSYGGTTALAANLPAAALSLWDCVFVPATLWPERLAMTWEPAIGKYITSDGRRMLVNPDMREEALGYGLDDMRRLAASLSVPTQIVVAEHGGHTDPAQDWTDEVPDPKDRVLIPGANHTFGNSTVIEDLCAATLAWFDRF
jgi:pimeloyl-ACP methyl ester carboxylesterase